MAVEEEKVEAEEEVSTEPDGTHAYKAADMGNKRRGVMPWCGVLVPVYMCVARCHAC